MTTNYKKYREDKIYKGIWLSQEEASHWDSKNIRGMLNGGIHMLNMNKTYVKQLEDIIKHLILTETNKEEDKIIDDIIRTSEEIR